MGRGGLAEILRCGKAASSKRCKQLSCADSTKEHIQFLLLKWENPVSADANVIIVKSFSFLTLKAVADSDSAQLLRAKRPVRFLARKNGGISPKILIIGAGLKM